MKWVEPQPVEAPPEVLAAVDGQALLARALVRRGVTTASQAIAFLDPAQYTMTTPFELPDMQPAVERLKQAVEAHERILVWGDFDTDGLTATAILVHALRHAEALVDWHIPDRRESHGVHWSTLQPYLGLGTRVLLTCDTGVSAHEALSLARQARLDVVVTDHHALPPTLPPALAIVNPKRLEPDHPLSALSGAGVALELIQALGVAGLGLDLAALGMIADVTPHHGDVRPLLQLGLAELRQTTRVGLAALMEAAGVVRERMDEDTVSFQLAPRLNALGRLSNASPAVELMLTDDLTRARVIAAEMEALNTKRQFLSQQLIAAARAQAQRQYKGALPPVLVLSHARWPGGVLGIAAGHLAHSYGRPVVLIATPEGEPARGSARSVEGVDIYLALGQSSELLQTFGGHPMAAGFAMSPERVGELRSALVRAVESQVGETWPERELTIDEYVPLSALSTETLRQARRLAPFGPGNPRLIFAARDLQVAESRALGRTGEHRLVRIRDGQGAIHEAVWWQSADLPVPEGSFDLAYGLTTSRLSEDELQLTWIDAREQVPVPVPEVREVRPVLVADYRTMAEPESILRAVWETGEMQLWAEAAVVTGFDARPRAALAESTSLVVWTAPPSPSVWREALQRAHPERVFLFACDPDLDTAERFLTRLASLVKYALTSHNSAVSWDALGGAMAHDRRALQAGLQWLQAKGQLTILADEPAQLSLAAGGPPDPRGEAAALLRLRDALRECSAYRRYFRSADAMRLVRGG